MLLAVVLCVALAAQLGYMVLVLLLYFLSSRQHSFFLYL